jgi:hypothetical protein
MCETIRRSKKASAQFRPDVSGGGQELSKGIMGAGVCLGRNYCEGRVLVAGYLATPCFVDKSLALARNVSTVKVDHRNEYLWPPFKVFRNSILRTCLVPTVAIDKDQVVRMRMHLGT